MMTGRSVHLLAETVGVDDQQVAVVVPAGESITVLSGPRSDDRHMVDVQWREKKLVMFSEDVEKRCNLVKDKSS